MDGNSWLLTDQAAEADLWRRGYRAFADGRIAALIVPLLTLGGACDRMARGLV
jgi:hypothetical protein